jgi:protein phosphatase
MATPTATELKIDAASAISQGARSRQEDAIATSFLQGADFGFAILSDGMGGHAAGDIASRIIVSEIFAEMTMRFGQGNMQKTPIPQVLRRSVKIANFCLRAHIEEHPEARGMGGTVVVAVTTLQGLYWLSVGDSPLLLYRDGKLVRLNDDHSMAPQIDLMVRNGLIDAETGRTHPQRSCLVSALTGDEIAEVDCPDGPFELRDGDVVIVASDGLQYLDDDRIVARLRRSARGQSARIADDLMDGVIALGDPEQDNVSIVVMKPGQREAHRRMSFGLPAAALQRVVSGAIAPVRHLIMRSG